MVTLKRVSPLTMYVATPMPAGTTVLSMSSMYFFWLSDIFLFSILNVLTKKSYTFVLTSPSGEPATKMSIDSFSTFLTVLLYEPLIAKL